MIGRMTQVVKQMFAIGDRAESAESSGVGVDGDGGGAVEPVQPDNVNET